VKPAASLKKSVEITFNEIECNKLQRLQNIHFRKIYGIMFFVRLCRELFRQNNKIKNELLGILPQKDRAKTKTL
jgi:hypothetical protein